MKKQNSRLPNQLGTKCRASIPAYARIPLTFEFPDDGHDRKFFRALKAQGLKASKIKMIENIISQITFIPGYSSYADILLEMENLLNKNEGKGKVHHKLKRYNRLADKIENTIVKGLMRSYIGAISSNSAWILRNMNELLTSDFSANLMSIKKIQKRRELNENERDQMVNFFEKIKLVAQNDIVFKMYLYRILDLFGERTQVLLRRKFKVFWSVNEIRQIIESPTLGHRYPYFWYPIVAEFVGVENASEYLLKSSWIYYLETGDAQAYSYLKYTFPNQQKIRDLIGGQLKKLMDSKNPYEQYAFLRAMENPSVASFVVKRHGKLKKPLFLLERNFYKSLLKQGKGLALALTGLLRLGDIDEDILWWIVI